MSGVRGWSRHHKWAGRRRRIALGLVVLAMASAAGGPSYAVQIASALHLESLFADRSPGSRGRAELVKIKSAAAAIKPQARALPRVRSAPDAVPQAAEIAPPGLAPIAAPDPFAPTAPAPVLASAIVGPQGASMPELAALSPRIAAAAIGGGAGGLVGRGITAPAESPPLSFETEPQRVISDTPAAVPEPATWLMLVIGFGLLGRRVRARAASVTGRSVEIA